MLKFALRRMLTVAVASPLAVALSCASQAQNTSLKQQLAGVWSLVAVETMTKMKLYDGLKPRIVTGSSITQAYQYVQTGAAESIERHPIGMLKSLGFRVTLNTDDLTVSDLTLSEEYLRVHRRLGIAVGELIAIAREGYAAAFLDAETRARLSSSFEAWLAARLS